MKEKDRNGNRLVDILLGAEKSGMAVSTYLEDNRTSDDLELPDDDYLQMIDAHYGPNSRIQQILDFKRTYYRSSEK